jgi:hypothetical protein
MVARCAQHSLDHRDYTRAVEQFFLVSIFLKDPCECESLYCAFTVVAGRRLNSDVRWVIPFTIFNGEEARIC